MVEAFQADGFDSFTMPSSRHVHVHTSEVASFQTCVAYHGTIGLQEGGVEYIYKIPFEVGQGVFRIGWCDTEADIAHEHPSLSQFFPLVM